jgi:hypothetical protein
MAKLTRKHRMFQRPENFTLDYSHPLAKGPDGKSSLVFAGLGNVPKGIKYSDSSLYKNNGTLTNFAWPNTATSGWGWDNTLKRPTLTGFSSTAYVQLPNALKDLPLLDFSVSFWAWAASVEAGADPALIAWAGTDDLIIYPFESFGGILCNRIFWRDVGENVGGIAPPIATWQHVCYTSRNGSQKLYFNGRLDISATKSTALAGPFTTVRIGNWADNPAQWSQSTVADVLFYSRVVSPGEVSLLADPAWSIDYGGLILPVWQRVFAAAVAGGTAYERTANDVLGITDAATRLSMFSRTAADLLGLLDAASRTAGFVRSSADSAGITDSTTGIAEYSRTIVDSLGLTDEASRILAVVRSITDPFGLTDTSERVAAFVRSADDPLGLTDAASRIFDAVRLVVDGIGLTDDVSRVATFARTLEDSEGLTDSIARVLEFVRSFDDIEGLTDSATTQLSPAASRAAVFFLLLQSAAWSQS